MLRRPSQPRLHSTLAHRREAFHRFESQDAHDHQKPTESQQSSQNTSICEQSSAHQEPLRREAVFSAAGLLLSAFLSSCQSANAGPFLKDTGGRGPLAEEEARIYQLRVEKEAEVFQDFDKEVRITQAGKLCATPFGVDVVGITEFIGLLGALVAGILARQRKMELQRLNEQLRKINLSLRQNARAGIVYAPGLTYAPPATDGGKSEKLDMGGVPSVAVPDAPEGEDAGSVAVLSPVTSVPSTSRLLTSLDEETMTEDQIHCRDALKDGKARLKEGNGPAAMVRFEKALMLSKGMKDKIQERRAMRGLAAAARLQGQFRTAIRHLEQVLEISKEIDDHIGDADAYGTIADVYTDLGEFEKAAFYYDMYISTMNTEGPV